VSELVRKVPASQSKSKREKQEVTLHYYCKTVRAVGWLKFELSERRNRSDLKGGETENRKIALNTLAFSLKVCNTTAFRIQVLRKGGLFGIFGWSASNLQSLNCRPSRQSSASSQQAALTHSLTHYNIALIAYSSLLTSCSLYFAETEW
jgi:hypothetical protein